MLNGVIMANSVNLSNLFFTSEVDFYELEALYQMSPIDSHSRKIISLLMQSVTIPPVSSNRKVISKVKLLREIIHDSEKVQMLNLRYLQNGYNDLWQVIEELKIPPNNHHRVPQTKVKGCHETQEDLEIKFTSHLALVNNNAEEYLCHLILIFYVSSIDHLNLFNRLLEVTKIQFQFDGIDRTDNLKKYNLALSVEILKRYGTNRLTFILRSIFSNQRQICSYIFSNFLTQISMQVQEVLFETFIEKKIKLFRSNPICDNEIPLIADSSDQHYLTHCSTVEENVKKRPAEYLESDSKKIANAEKEMENHTKFNFPENPEEVGLVPSPNHQDDSLYSWLNNIEAQKYT